MKIRRNRFVHVITFALAFAAPSCGSDGGTEAPASQSTAGTIDVDLTLGGSTVLTSFTYTVTGPAGFSRTATIDVSQSAALSTTIPAIPAGSGYSIAITGTSTDGSTTCSGSKTFSVVAGATTPVGVNLQCHETPRKGSVLVTGQLNPCPVIDGIGANPAEALLGGTIALSAAAHDSNAAPAALSYQWSTTSGTLSSATSAAPTLTCTASGPATVTVAVSDGDAGCTETLSATVQCTSDPVTTVAATVETTPVPDSGDAADDPAIWVNPGDSAQSVIIGTDKQAGGGLGVYGLDGHQIQYVPSGKLNNVDLRDGFLLGGSSVPLVTAGNRTDNTIAIFKLDPTTRTLTDLAARKITTLATYGSCMYHSPVTGKFYYFVDSKAGAIEQWELFESAGKVDAVKVRDLHPVASQPEACAVDDENKAFFLGEEARGVWKYDAEPTVTSGPGFDGVLIASTDPGGHLARDVEGLAIGKTSATSGFIFVSNQGESTYTVLTREAPHAYVKTFRVERGSACVDPVALLRPEREQS